MARWQCNSCGATYHDTMRDGSTYFHACGPEIVTRETLDDKGQIKTPRVERERANKRDENHLHVLGIDAEQKAWFERDPDDVTRRIYHHGPVPMLSEGAGRTRLADE
jgi:hypothetical protein